MIHRSMWVALDGQVVYIMMEDDAVLATEGMRYSLPRQTEWFLVQ